MIDVIIKGRGTGKTTQGIEWARRSRHGLVVCPTPAIAEYLRDEYGDNDRLRFATPNQRSMLRGNSFDRIFIDECFYLDDTLEYLRRDVFPMLYAHVGNQEPLEDRVLMIGTPMGPKPKWLEENEGSLFNIKVEKPDFDIFENRYMREVAEMEWNNPDWTGFLQEFTQPKEGLLSFEF